MDSKSIREHSSAGLHQECLQACQQLLQNEPENPLPWKYAGKSLLALGQFVKAQQCLTKAHQLDRTDAETIKDIGNIFNALQNEKEAIRLYKAALSVDENYAPAINNLGLIAQRKGNLAAAEQLVARARDLDQSFAPYHMNLGSIYKDLGNLDQALASTLKSLELKPDNPDALMNLGGIYEDLGNLDQALASTLKSLELKPNNPDAHLNLGSIYKNLGNIDQALASTLKSTKLKPDNHTAHLNLGGIYRDLCNLDQALASTLKSLELKPDNPAAHMTLGSIYQDLGNLDQALASTLKSLELKPDNPDAHMNLGGIYKNLGNLDQALTSTLKSLELKPNNPNAHINMGIIYRDIGKLDQAIKYFREAAKAEAFREKASIEIAEIYLKKKLFKNGIDLVSELNSKPAKNLMLALCLSAGDKSKFNNCANDLISSRLLDTRGIAAIDHANILYRQNLQNGLHRNTLELIANRSVDRNEFSESLLEEILQDLKEKRVQRRPQGLLVNGIQTSGNILDTPKKAYLELKNLLIQAIDEYCKKNAGIVEGDFASNWRKNLYNLRGWAIIMSKGGNLLAHNHEKGFLTGTFYLKMPERKLDENEGAILFSHQGPYYAPVDSDFPKKVIRPKSRDLNIFPSSIYHKTLPFESEEQRICIAFDIGLVENK